MQKQATGFGTQVWRVVIAGWLVMNTPAQAQNGVIVIRGEITAPTCELNHFNYASTKTISAGDRLACPRHIEPFNVTAIPDLQQVRDQALANETKDERIRTITYR